MKNKPLVTIRIPAYNHEDFIEKAVMSAINQSYTNIELIVIDDGSRDKTPEIAQRLADKYGFTFIRQENVGVSETMNRLFALSNGEYILGCASDDFLDENAVENALKIALETKADIVCGRVKVVDSNNCITNELNFNPNEIISKERILRRKNSIPKQGFFYRRDILESVYPIPKDVKIEDAFTFLKLPNNTNFHSCNEVFKYYRQHGENTIADKYSMYQKKRDLLKRYSDTSVDKVYILASKFGWFRDLALSYPFKSIRYFIPATFFVITSGFPKNLIKAYLSGILRLINIDFTKFGD